MREEKERRWCKSHIFKKSVLEDQVTGYELSDEFQECLILHFLKQTVEHAACGNLVLDSMLKKDDGIEDVSLDIRYRKRKGKKYIFS